MAASLVIQKPQMDSWTVQSNNPLGLDWTDKQDTPVGKESIRPPHHPVRFLCLAVRLCV